MVTQDFFIINNSTGLRVSGSGFSVEGLGVRVSGSRFRVWGSRFKVRVPGLGFREGEGDAPKHSALSLRVQVPNKHILPPKSNLQNYYPKPKYFIIWFFGPIS